MGRQHILGCATILGALLVLSLMIGGVVHYPASIQGSGSGLLRMDVALLLLYGIAGGVAWKQKDRNSNTAAAIVGARAGLLLGGVQIANHLIEVFVPNRPVGLVIGPVLLMLGLLGTAGAAACTKSLVLGVTGGVWCAIVATLITLSFAISFNLLFAARVDRQLHEAFATSGMIDPGGFRVRNMLEASSEILIRMPLFAACLAFAGAVIQAWMSRESRRMATAASFVAPLMFVAGTSSLWHASALERDARPPFVMSGVLLSGLALCAAYPIWSIRRSLRGNTRNSAN